MIAVLETQINAMLKSGVCNVDINKIKVIKNTHDNNLRSLIQEYDQKHKKQLENS